MLLIMNGLPPKARYNDVRKLLLDACGLDNVIVDKIVDDGNNGKKVMVGFADEADANMAIQRLNGYQIGQHTIFFDQPAKRPVVFKQEGVSSWQAGANAGSSPAGGAVPPWARRVPPAPAPAPSPPQLQQQPLRPFVQNFDSDADALDVQRGRFDQGPGRAPGAPAAQRFQPRDDPPSPQRFEQRFQPERPPRFHEEMRPRWGAGGGGGASGDGGEEEMRPPWGGLGGNGGGGDVEMRPRWGGGDGGTSGGHGDETRRWGGGGRGSRGGGREEMQPRWGGGEGRAWERSPPRRSPSPLAKRMRIEEQVSSAVQAALRQLSARTLLETLSTLQGGQVPPGAAFAPNQRQYGPPQRDRFRDRRSPVSYPNKRRRSPPPARGMPPRGAPSRGGPSGRGAFSSRGAPSGRGGPTRGAPAGRGNRGAPAGPGSRGAPAWRGGRGAPGRDPVQRPRSPPAPTPARARAAQPATGTSGLSRGAETRRSQVAAAVAQRVLDVGRLQSRIGSAAPEWLRRYKRAIFEEVVKLAAREFPDTGEQEALRMEKLHELYDDAHPDAAKHMRTILEGYLGEMRANVPNFDTKKLRAEIQAAVKDVGSGPAPAPKPGASTEVKKAAARSNKEAMPTAPPPLRKKINIPLLDHYERGIAVYKLVAQLLDTKRVSESFGKCFRHVIRQRLDDVLGTKTGVKCDAMMDAYRRTYSLASDRAALDDFKETYIGRNARVDVAKFRAQCILAEQARKTTSPAFNHKKFHAGRSDPKEPASRRLCALLALQRELFGNALDGERLRACCRQRLQRLLEQVPLQLSFTVDTYHAKFRKLHPREKDDELVEQMLKEFAEEMKQEGEEVDVQAIQKEVAAAREKLALVETLSESDRNARAEAADQILNNMLDHERIMHKRFVICLHEAILDRIHMYLCDEKDLPAGNIVALYRQQHPDDSDDGLIEEVRKRVEEIGVGAQTPDLATQIRLARGDEMNGADGQGAGAVKSEPRRSDPGPSSFKATRANTEQFRLEGAGEPYYDSLSELHRAALDDETKPILDLVEEGLSLPKEGVADEHVAATIREKCAPEINRMMRVELSKRILDIKNNLICRVTTFPKMIPVAKVRAAMKAVGAEPCHLRRSDRRYMLLAYFDTYARMDRALAAGTLRCDNVNIIIGYLHAVPFKLDPSQVAKAGLVDAPDDSFQVVDSTYDDDADDQWKPEVDDQCKTEADDQEKDVEQKLNASGDVILVNDNEKELETITLDDEDQNGTVNDKIETDLNDVTEIDENDVTEIDENDVTEIHDDDETESELVNKDGTENDVHDNGAENNGNESKMKDDGNNLDEEIEDDADVSIVNNEGSAEERYTYNDAGELFCEPCSRTFKNKTGFNSHMRSHKK